MFFFWDFYGFLWISMDFYGFLWISMDFLGIFPMIFRRQQGARVGAGGSWATPAGAAGASAGLDHAAEHRDGEVIPQGSPKNPQKHPPGMVRNGWSTLVLEGFFRNHMGLIPKEEMFAGFHHSVLRYNWDLSCKHWWMRMVDPVDPWRRCAIFFNVPPATGKRSIKKHGNFRFPSFYGIVLLSFCCWILIDVFPLPCLIPNELSIWNAEKHAGQFF